MLEENVGWISNILRSHKNDSTNGPKKNTLLEY